MFVLLFLFTGNREQQRVTPPSSQKEASAFQEVRIDKERPSVFLTFDRAGQREPLKASESPKAVWLRLHNNTRWPIMVFSRSAPSDKYGDALLFFDVVLEGKVIIEDKCHTCSFSNIEPGRSLLFSLPSDSLSKDQGIRVLFNYGWEKQNDVLSGREPEHYAYFYSSQLPKSSEQGKQDN
jgi:hypothetical protein